MNERIFHMSFASFLFFVFHLNVTNVHTSIFYMWWSLLHHFTSVFWSACSLFQDPYTLPIHFIFNSFFLYCFFVLLWLRLLLLFENCVTIISTFNSNDEAQHGAWCILYLSLQPNIHTTSYWHRHIDYRCLLFYFISIHNNTSPEKEKKTTTQTITKMNL